MSKSLRIVSIVLALSALPAVGVMACELTYTLIGSNGASQAVIPGREVSLNRGEVYSLMIHFKEDHNRCKVEPEETVFLLDEEKWKATKGHLPLQLLDGIEWADIDSRNHETELQFKAVRTGNWELEIIRECDTKDGYDEFLLFSVR